MGRTGTKLEKVRVGARQQVVGRLAIIAACVALLLCGGCCCRRQNKRRHQRGEGEDAVVEAARVQESDEKLARRFQGGISEENGEDAAAVAVEAAREQEKFDDELAVMRSGSGGLGSVPSIQARK